MELSLERVKYVNNFMQLTILSWIVLLDLTLHHQNKILCKINAWSCISILHVYDLYFFCAHNLLSFWNILHLEPLPHDESRLSLLHAKWLIALVLTHHVESCEPNMSLSFAIFKKKFTPFLYCAYVIGLLIFSTLQFLMIGILFLAFHVICIFSFCPFIWWV